jgi:hypothetical protein
LSRTARKTLLCAGGFTLLAVVLSGLLREPESAGSNRADERSSDTVAIVKAHRAHQCMGIIGDDVSVDEWERQLSGRAKHLGIDVEDLQVLDMLATEQRQPGVVGRCTPKR